MHHWLYVSKCTIEPHDARAAVESIVTVAMNRNPELGVTGGLFFTGSHFAQLIEGPASGILALKSSILGDARHSEITTLLDGRCDQRRFAGWSLAYSGPSLVVNRAIQRGVRAAVEDRRRAADVLLELMSETISDKDVGRSLSN